MYGLDMTLAKLPHAQFPYLSDRFMKKEVDKFSFTAIAKLVIERQKIDKDTIIITTGDRGAGKSNWLLKLILAFIKEKKRNDPTYKWNWKYNFPLSREQAIENVEKIQ